MVRDNLSAWQLSTTFVSHLIHQSKEGGRGYGREEGKRKGEAERTGLGSGDSCRESPNITLILPMVQKFQLQMCNAHCTSRAASQSKAVFESRVWQPTPAQNSRHKIPSTALSITIPPSLCLSHKRRIKLPKMLSVLYCFLRYPTEKRHPS